MKNECVQACFVLIPFLERYCPESIPGGNFNVCARFAFGPPKQLIHQVGIFKETHWLSALAKKPLLREEMGQKWAELGRVHARILLRMTSHLVLQLRHLERTSVLTAEMVTKERKM